MKITFDQKLSADKFNISFPISKTEKMDDGRLKVQGLATSEALDHAGEIVDYETAKAAFAVWKGNIREQHDAKKAVGKAIEVVANDDTKQIMLTAFISKGAVDTQEKILDGTLSDFSIGGSISKRVSEKVEKGGQTITAERLMIKKITETSVVDAGCNPESSFSIVKTVGDDLIAVGVDDEPEVVEKGMYSLSHFACVLDGIADIANSAQYESEWEGDNSPVPAQLREWLAAGIAILKAMTEEETAELLANLKQNAGEVEVVEMAAKTDLEKAGARNSKTDAEKIQGMHDAAVDLGATCSAEKHEHADIVKTEIVEIESMKDADLEKVAEVWFLKFAAQKGIDAKSFVEAFEKLDGEITLLKSENATLKAMPSAPKGSLMAISKGDDLGGEEINKVEPVLKADGSVDEELTLFKVARSNPIRMF